VGTANFYSPTATIDVVEGIQSYMRKYNFERVTDMIGLVK